MREDTSTIDDIVTLEGPPIKNLSRLKPQKTSEITDAARTDPELRGKTFLTGDFMYYTTELVGDLLVPHVYIIPSSSPWHPFSGSRLNFSYNRRRAAKVLKREGLCTVRSSSEFPLQHSSLAHADMYKLELTPSFPVQDLEYGIAQVTGKMARKLPFISHPRMNLEKTQLYFDNIKLIPLWHYFTLDPDNLQQLNPSQMEIAWYFSDPHWDTTGIGNPKNHLQFLKDNGIKQRIYMLNPQIVIEAQNQGYSGIGHPVYFNASNFQVNGENLTDLFNSPYTFMRGKMPIKDTDKRPLLLYPLAQTVFALSQRIRDPDGNPDNGRNA